MNSFGKLGEQLRLVWNGMSPRRRTLMVGVFVLGVGVVLSIGYFASRPDYHVLFSGVAPEDSAAVTAKLQAKAVPYKLEAGGTTILVPIEKLQQARIEMAAEGLPANGGRGYEIFDGSSLGMTPFTQQINYLRALQAELARTIMQIDPVTHARVHVVRPESTPFIRDQKPTTASVVVRLRPGASLDRQVASSIVALVSRSVEGLTRENVTIVDTQGRLLSEEVNPETGLIGSHLDYRRELERHLSMQAEKMLAKVVGPGRAIVRVTADLNFQRHREKKETYNPENRVATKEIISSSKSGGAAAAKGVVGAAGNVGKGERGGAASGPSSEETIQTDYAVSKITQEVEEKHGALERLTVAVLVDLSATAEEGKGLDLTDAEEIVKQAVGFKAGRDDMKITDVRLNVPHEPLPPEETAAGGEVWHNVLTLVRFVSLGLAALAALSIGWMVYKSRRTRLDAEDAETARPTEDAAPALQDLTRALEQNPEVLIRILESWLKESDPPGDSEQSGKMAA